jgi:outer membrane protein assembly factor BamB
MSRITTIFIFTAVMLFNLSSGAQAADWNMWGKDAGHTSFTTDSVEPPLKVSWTFDLGFPSSFEPVPPVVSNNTVYINGISVDGQNVQNWLFAIDAKSGKLLWKYKGGGYPVWIASSGDLVVVSDGVNVYALSNGAEKWKREIGSGNQPLIIYKNLVLSGQAFALSLENGSLVWTYEPKLPSADETHLVNNWARPLAAGEDKVILAVQSIQTYYTGPRVPTVTEPPKPGEPIPPEPPQNISTILFALNAKTGKEEWVKRIPFSIESAPVISKGKVFIGSNGSVQAYLLEDGREVWRTVLPGFRKVEAVNDNLLFVGGTALSMEDGKKAFTYESSLSFPSLAVSGNILYIGGSSDSAVLEALNATTGELIWRGVKVLGYNSASKPVISGDKLFLTAQDGKLYAFSHGTPGADETLGLPMRAPSLGAALSILVLLGAFIIRRRRNDLG